MKIVFIKSTWGMTELSLEEKLKRISGAGYDGVEMNVPEEAFERDAFGNLLSKYGLKFVAQQWTAGASAAEQKESLKKQFLANIQCRPLLINCHTGRDYFSTADNTELIQESYALAKEYHVPLTHETHRGRFAYHPGVTAEYLSRIPELKLTADFSHWCCVSESMLQDHRESLDLAMKRSIQIHARVGHEQGPQVSDPRAPEWKEHLDIHCGWWGKIARYQKENGLESLIVTPEFGPPNYMATTPFTREPLSDLWDINLFMKEKLASVLRGIAGE